LIKRLHIENSKAIIYVKSNWKSFNNEDIEILKKDGIKYVKILITINSIHKTIMDLTQISKLDYIFPENIKQENNSNTYIGLTFFIIFILIYFYINS
jgi:hypothetical protein